MDDHEPARPSGAPTNLVGTGSDVVTGLCLLFGAQWAGDALARLFGLPIPGTIVGIGLALVLVGFPMGRSLPIAARPLLHNLPLFLVPIGASLINQAEILRHEGFVLLLAVIGSTVLTMAATHVTFAVTMRWIEGQRR